MTVISSPELAREILVERKHTFHRGTNFNGGTPLTILLGLSLLTTDGESWLSKRRTMQPIFHRQRIVKMGDTMTDAGEKMLQRWQALSDNEIELSEEMKLVTLDIINRTMFSADVMGEVDTVGSVVDIGVHYIRATAVITAPRPNELAHPQQPSISKSQSRARRLSLSHYSRTACHSCYRW